MFWVAVPVTVAAAVLTKTPSAAWIRTAVKLPTSMSENPLPLL